MSTKPLPPVFYDRTGKRLPRIFLMVVLVLCAVGGAVFIVATQSQASLWSNNSDSHFARRYLGERKSLPVPAVGSGPLTRMVTVERDGDRVKLLDSVTGEYVRDATEWEQADIGDSPYAVDYFSGVPDHTLILTFDDGPDPEWTPTILDILSREGVPGTFFVVGQKVVENPGLVRREVREGHMVGNHSMTHPELDKLPGSADKSELLTTDRVIRASADYATPLFRLPFGDPMDSPVGQVISQQLGYLEVDYDLDTHDWKYEASREEVPVPALDGKGHVVLMHDGGGDRAATIRMLEKLITEAKARGYTFATPGILVPTQYLPQKITPSLIDRLTLWGIQGKNVGLGAVLKFVIWFTLGSMIVLTLAYLILSSINEWRQRRRVWRVPDARLPFVSITLAAYNEEKVIRRTLETLFRSDYPADRYEVIVANDGSTDRTGVILEHCVDQWPQLRVVHQANAGKSTALNNAIRHADPRSTVIVTMDADTLFRRATVYNLARHFAKNTHGKQVGVVSGHIKVGNRRNLLTWWQSLEYLNGICVIRMAEMMVGAVCVVPGACSAWRRSALERIGGFTEDTLAEDADAAMTLQKLRYAVIHDNHALSDTEAPETIRPLLKQRKRWMFGNLQVMWKNRDMLLRPRYGALGMITMPYAVAQLFLNFLFLPVLLVMSVMAAFQGAWKDIVSFGIIVFIVHVVVTFTALAIAREKLWHVLVLPFYRPIYEVMRLYLLYACAWRVLKGAEFSWDKLERLNTVTDADAPALPAPALPAWAGAGKQRDLVEALS